MFEEYYNSLFIKTSLKESVRENVEELLTKNNKEKIKNALDKAWEIRNFEIEMYWKRATYFWTFIASIFIAFIAVFCMDNKSFELQITPFFKGVLGNNNFISQENLLLGIVLLGVAFSFAWFLANNRSKFWQKNWEYHIELLEDAFYGKLYKTVISDKANRGSCSLSGINRGISFVVLVFWFYILLNTLGVNFWGNKFIITVLASLFTFPALFWDDIKKIIGTKNKKQTYLYFNTREIDSIVKK